MSVAVVIPALREADRIEAAVASALQGSGGSRETPGEAVDDVSVLVVDGGSDDETRDRAERAGASILVSAPGRAVQLAAGCAHTTAPIVLFLHADTRLPQGWLRRVKGALRDPDVVGGAFGFRFDRRSPRLAWIEWGVKVRNVLFRLPYGDQAIFARRTAIEEMGGLPRAPIMEDLDLVRELKRRGRFVLIPDPVSTSARRYERAGPVRTFLRNVGALLAWRLGVDRHRVARWYRA
mgnify:CR=1 FL=1